MPGQLVYIIQLHSDMHRGSGLSAPGEVDSAVDRDAGGLPRVLGTTIKGRARDGALRALEWLGHPQPSGSLLAISLFGAGGGAAEQARRGAGTGPHQSTDGRFVFLPAVLPKSRELVGLGHLMTDRRFHNKVDERLGRVSEDFFFSREVVPPNLQFLGRVTWEHVATRDELALLALSLRMIESLGGKRSRGEGLCLFKLLGAYAGQWDPAEDTVPTGVSPLRTVPEDGKPLDLLSEIEWFIDGFDPDRAPDGPASSSQGWDSAPDRAVASDEEVLFQVAIETLSPTVAGNERAAGNQISSGDFIAGTQLRGALAAKVMSLGVPEPRMSDLFGSAGIGVSNQYPGRVLKHPIPLSARQSKYPSPGASYVDVLLNPPGNREPLRHPAGNAPLVPAAGAFVSIFSEGPTSPEDARKAQPGRAVSAHVEIDPITGVHREGVLFTLEALSENQDFTGSIACTVQQAAVLAKVLALLRNGDGLLHGTVELSIGQARSRGMGRVRAKLAESKTLRRNDMEARLARLNTAANRTDGRLRFSLTLLSDAIVTDERLRFRSGLDAGDLVRECPALSPFLDGLEKAVVGAATVCGWHGAAGLPRADDAAIAMGSAFLYRCRDGVAAAHLVPVLEALEKAGIGCRRHEGYGRVAICAHWHSVGWQSLVNATARGGRL